MGADKRSQEGTHKHIKGSLLKIGRLQISHLCWISIYNKAVTIESQLIRILLKLSFIRGLHRTCTIPRCITVNIFVCVGVLALHSWDTSWLCRVSLCTLNTTHAGVQAMDVSVTVTYAEITLKEKRRCVGGCRIESCLCLYSHWEIWTRKCITDRSWLLWEWAAAICSYISVKTNGLGAGQRLCFRTQWWININMAQIATRLKRRLLFLSGNDRKLQIRRFFTEPMHMPKASQN